MVTSVWILSPCVPCPHICLAWWYSLHRAQGLGQTFRKVGAAREFDFVNKLKSRIRKVCSSWHFSGGEDSVPRWEELILSFYLCVREGEWEIMLLPHHLFGKMVLCENLLVFFPGDWDRVQTFLPLHISWLLMFIQPYLIDTKGQCVSIILVPLNSVSEQSSAPSPALVYSTYLFSEILPV